MWALYKSDSSRVNEEVRPIPTNDTEPFKSDDFER